MFKQLITSACRAAAPSSTRTFVSFARPVSRPLSRGLAFPTETASQPSQPVSSLLTPISAPQSILDVFNQQRRFKSRGNTYQPSMLKRKRRAGFLARLRTKGGRKILSRRRDKGRWFLTY